MADSDLNGMIASAKELSTFPDSFLSEDFTEEDRPMGRRWTEQDVSELRHLAQRYSAPRIAELTNRTVGGVAFKAYQLKLPLRPSHHENEPDAGVRPEAVGTDWSAAGNVPTETR